MIETLATQRWNEEYVKGRYDGEPPLPFVHKILDHLGEEGKSQAGIYVGCGNGRNYVPMFEAGLNLTGVDPAGDGIRQLVERCPAAKDKVLVRDFLSMPSARVWDYVVSIQTFQLGDASTVDALFDRTHEALRPGGKLFLRINASDTQPFYKHHVVEGRKTGTRTLRFEEGPKKDLNVRYFSRQALGEIAANTGFTVIDPITKVSEQRTPSKTGTWSQWETIWQRTEL